MEEENLRGNPLTQDFLKRGGAGGGGRGRGHGRGGCSGCGGSAVLNSRLDV